MTALGPTRRRHEGFTLVELLVTVAMIGLVFAAITAAFTVFIRNSDDLDDKLNASQNAQRLAIHLPPDAQSSQTAEASPAGLTCATRGDAVLALDWTDESTSASYRVEYTLDASTDELVRTACTGTSTDETVVGREIIAASATVTDPVVSITATSVDADAGTYDYTITGRKRT